MAVHDKYKKFVKNQRRFFDELITEDWDDYTNKFWDFTRLFEVQKILAATKPKKILNIGCGCGFHDFYFAKDTNVESVLGIDYSAKSIEKANKIYSHPKIVRKVVDIFTDESIPDTYYDLVTSFQVIEHVEEYAKFFQIMHKKVKSGGFMAIATPNFDNFANKIRKIFKKEQVFCDIMHFKEFNIKDLISLGKHNNLKLLKFFGYGFSFNVHMNLNKYIPNKFLFYLGRLFPKSSNVLVIIFQKI